MFGNKSELLELYNEECEKTKQVFSLLTPEVCRQSIAPGFKTAGELALHIILAIPAITKSLNFLYADLPSDKIIDQPNLLVEHYQRTTKQCAEQISQRDETELFQQKFTVYSQQWTAAYTLSILIRHEIHHRGQLSVLMRQAGAALPDIYGPSKRDHAANLGPTR